MGKIAKAQGTRIAVLFLGATLVGCGQAAADQVIPDDLIVQGSTCSGFDCVNNESFGFDTLRLKENNTRIGFLDTSVGAFPSNDWTITANDSASGGANYLAFDDVTGGKQPFRVTAGAPTSALFVASTGNVGLNTAVPTLDLHINTGDTAAIRLEQNSGGGFGSQTWDVAGNEANFFVRDLTGGSRLPFRIRPGAPTSSLDIAASGNVGIGTAGPTQKLQIGDGTGSVRARFSGTAADLYIGQNGAAAFGVAANSLAMLIQDSTLAFPLGLGTIGAQPVIVGTANTERMRIAGSGNVGIGTTAPATQLHTTGTVRFAGVPNCAAGIRTDAAGNLSCITSSARFKDIRGMLSAETAIANVMALRPQVGAYTETPDVQEHWLIAEDVAAVDPALVGFRDGEPYTVKTQNVVADLVAVIQEQQRRIEALEKAIAAR